MPPKKAHKTEAAELPKAEKKLTAAQQKKADQEASREHERDEAIKADPLLLPHSAANPALTITELFSKVMQYKDYTLQTPLSGRGPYDWSVLRTQLAARKADSPRWFMHVRSEDLLLEPAGLQGAAVEVAVIVEASEPTLAPMHMVIRKARPFSDLEDNTPERILKLHDQGLCWRELRSDSGEEINVFVLQFAPKPASALGGPSFSFGAKVPTTTTAAVAAAAPTPSSTAATPDSPAPSPASQSATTTAAPCGFGNLTPAPTTAGAPVAFGFGAVQPPPAAATKQQAPLTPSFGFGAAVQQAPAAAATAAAGGAGFGGGFGAAGSSTANALAAAAALTKAASAVGAAPTAFGAALAPITTTPPPPTAAAGAAAAAPAGFGGRPVNSPLGAVVPKVGSFGAAVPAPTTTGAPAAAAAGFAAGFGQAAAGGGKASDEKIKDLSSVTFVLWTEKRLKEMKKEILAGSRIVIENFVLPAPVNGKIKLQMQNDMHDKVQQTVDFVLRKEFAKMDPDMVKLDKWIDDCPVYEPKFAEAIQKFRDRQLSEAIENSGSGPKSYAALETSCGTLVRAKLDELVAARKKMLQEEADLVDEILHLVVRGGPLASKETFKVMKYYPANDKLHFRPFGKVSGIHEAGEQSDVCIPPAYVAQNQLLLSRKSSAQ